VKPPTWSQVDSRTFAFAVIAPSLWATSFLAAKFAVSSIPPLTAAAFRFLMVAAVLWLLLWLFHQSQPVSWRDVPLLALTGLFQTTFYFALQYSGLTLTTASNGAILVNTRPIFVALIATFCLHESFVRRETTGIAIAFGGVVLIAVQNSGAQLGLTSEHLLGDLLLLLNAASGAVGLILTKRVLFKFKPLTALVYTNSFGALGLLPFAAWELAHGANVTSASATPWLVLVYQAVFTTVIAHLLWNTALAKVKASWAAVFLYITPVVAIVLSWVILGEPLTWPILLGAALVIAGTHLVSRRGGSPQETSLGTPRVHPGMN
jgi:drug/metabolite transporter (DMT)-like permease